MTILHTCIAAGVMLMMAMVPLMPAMAAPDVAHPQSEPISIQYAKFSALDDPREKFPLAVLELVLEKMRVKYQISPCPDVMERGRALLELQQGRRVNLIWTSMSQESEKNLRPIRIPIFRGLIGHRLFLIPKSLQANFAKIKNLDDLKKYHAGVGLGWVDGKIMELAGLRVVRDKYDMLFKLLDNELIDYFPRGANEVFAELAAHQAKFPNLMIEPKLLLVYKSDLIFYTNKKDEALAALIEKGMQLAYEDGSYLKLFNEHPYVMQVLHDAALEKRIRIELPNPMLSDEDRAIPAKYWLDGVGRNR